MKIYLTLFFLIISNLLFSREIWTGEQIKFIKPDGADWTLPENQDRITDSVWITRADNQGIFNIAKEEFYTKRKSPTGTLWAFGNTKDSVELLEFFSWEDLINGGIKIVEKELVVYLINEEIYFDIYFWDWSSGKQGGKGGFSYSRSTRNIQNIVENDLYIKFKIYPNPCANFIKFDGISLNNINYEIYNVQGEKILDGILFNDNLIDVTKLNSGFYFIVFEKGIIRKFIKRELFE